MDTPCGCFLKFRVPLISQQEGSLLCRGYGNRIMTGVFSHARTVSLFLRVTREIDGKLGVARKRVSCRASVS